MSLSNHNRPGATLAFLACGCYALYDGRDTSAATW